VPPDRAVLRRALFCSPHHQDSALFPFIDQLGRAAGFAQDDPPPARLDKLEVLLARAAPPDEDVALLADLMSLPTSEQHPVANLSTQRKKERTLEALLRQLKVWRATSPWSWSSKTCIGSTPPPVSCST
jgi:predicted ATPase